jgi:hypothetical protein
MLRKIGGIWWVRLGRLRVSFCMVRRVTPTYPCGNEINPC